MIDFSAVKGVHIPEGDVSQIEDSQGNVLWNILPNEYERLEYIQSSGTQYIDTGVLLNYATTKLEQRAVAQYTTSNSSRELMGANGYGFWGKNAQNKLESAVGASAGITESALAKNTVSLTTNPSDMSVVFTVNGKRYASSSSTFANNFYAAYVFAIGGRDGAAPSFFCHARVYEYTVLLDDEVVSQLVPCRRRADGVLGMYDLVARRFRTNAGTGTFVAPTGQ